VANLYDVVKESGELDRTVFIYLSDNGLFYGEHRLDEGKVFPYEGASRLPLVMRVPKRYRDDTPRVSRTDKLVGNIDIAPTILELAHAKPCTGDQCRTMDGRSLMPLIEKRGPWPRDRALLNEYRVPDVARYSTCEFAAVRTRSELYVEHYRAVDATTGECHPTLQLERYNLAADPFELNSRCIGGAPGSCPHDAMQNKLEDRLERLRRCAGIKGRDRRVARRPFCG
jgi:arylsulfatase A-like enzyme